MADEGFLKRWSRRKIDARQGHEPPPEEPPAPALEPAPAPAQVDVPAHADALAPAPAREVALETEAAPPTMADVALLTPQSDFSAFVRQGVDADVRRTALKKLFTDPHFNTMDRLDIYMDDYTKPSPVSEAMLASLRHAKSVFRHLAEDDEAEAGADAGAVATQEPQLTQDPQDQQDPPPPALESDPANDPDPDPEPQAIAAATYQQHPPETETR